MSDLTKGVAFNDPPGKLLADALKFVNQGVAKLPHGTNGALVTVVSEAGVNVAVVAKQGTHLQVQGWIGKSWGNAIYGGGAATLVW